MAKVRYKEISPEMEEIMKPSETKTPRFSIGMEDKVQEYYYISVVNLKPYRNQARQKFCAQELEELAATVQEHGVCQPLSVIASPEQDGTYEVISGERRLRAAKIAGLDKVPCIILKNQGAAKEIALIENIQRSDLHPVELASAYSHILEDSMYGGVSALAKKIGKPVSTVSELTKLHDLPEEIKQHLVEKNIRSRVVFRKLALLEDLESMKAFLGITRQEKPFLKSVLRVSLTQEGFVLEKNAIRNLSSTQKEKLKEALRGLLEAI